MNAFIVPHIRFLVMVFFLLIMAACTKENPSRHLDLGNWYLQRGLLDEAITEYREVSRRIVVSRAPSKGMNFKYWGLHI